MKKIICLLAAILMLAAGFALAEEMWDFNTNDYAVEGYSGPGGDVVIPEEIQGCTVDIIGLGALNAADGITSLTLPDTLRQVEDSAVSFCDDLAALELNEGLMIIGDNCFNCNNALTEVTIPASVCYIGNGSFDSCENLRTIRFMGACPVFAGVAFDWIAEDAVIYVPDDQLDAYAEAFTSMDGVFNLQPSGENAEIYDYSTDPELFGFDAETGTVYSYDAYSVRLDVPAEIGGVAVRAIDAEFLYDDPYICWLSLPEGVEVIGASAFDGCIRLVHIEFPSTLRHIGSRAFANGLKTRGLVLPEGLESIGDEAFQWAVWLQELKLPAGLKTIGARAFDGCSWLEEVSIPASVEAIGENAFANSGTAYVVFEGLQLPEMPDNVFENCAYLTDIDLHTKAGKQQMLDLQAVVDGLGLSCRVWRAQNPEVDYIGDGLDVYENGVLTAYSGEQTHIRPWDSYDDCTVTAVGDGAFRGNSCIEYFAVPYNDAFTTIGAEAFADSALMRVDLFDSVTTIKDGAFRNCAQLTELVLPESVTFVGSEALGGCTGLEKLTVLCDPCILPEDLLAGCPAEMEVYAAVDATDEQLKYLSKLAGRAFYEPVTRLGESAPELYASPYEALPGEDFWYDGDFARLDCYEGYELNLVLPSVIDGNSLTMIGGGMMQRASYGDNYEAELPVVSLVIPGNYTEIPPYAFQNCETLETVVCYAPIEMLADGCFANCTALREVIFVNGVHGIGQYVFDNCPSLETVYIGQYAENISETAFLNLDGSAAFDAAACITDPAYMPDIDALLEAVRRDPMPVPEPEPAPVAEPVGEEGKPFFGVWHGTEIIMDGNVYSFTDFEMVMTLLLCEDGRLIMSESEAIDLSLVGDGDWYAWRVEDGVAYAEQYSMTIQADGRLCLEEEGMRMLFEYDADADIPDMPAVVPAAASEVSAPAAAAQSAAVREDYLETRFVCVNADVEGYTLDAALLGGEYALTLHADGTTDFVLVGTAVHGVLWSTGENGNVLLDYYGTIMELVWTEKVFDLNYFDTMLLHFVPAEE